MPFVTSELHSRSNLIVRALVHQTPIDGRKGQWAEHRCSINHRLVRSSEVKTSVNTATYITKQLSRNSNIGTGIVTGVEYTTGFRFPTGARFLLLAITEAPHFYTSAQMTF
jgi:hypothetical protein